MDQKEIEVTAFEIADEHGCHTVILYGSLARGAATDGSDVDLLCIRDNGPAVRVARLIDGVFFDVFVYPPEAVSSTDPALLRIVGGRVLRERDECGTILLDRVREVFSRGPAPLAPDERTARIVWAHKMLERLRRHEGANTDYRRMVLLVQALEDYFALRTLWFRGSKEAFSWLQSHDNRAYGLFQLALRPGANRDELLGLVHAVYGRMGGRDEVGPG